MSKTETVYAAGAVVWREIEGDVHVLVIHRTFHKDISLPKGKVDPGETFPVTAVREIREETGIKIALGAPVGVSKYLMPNGKNKEVHYWAGHATPKAIAKSTFVPNDEVAALEWLPIAEARTVLTYDPDREILDNFTALIERDVRETFAIVVARHATSVQAGIWMGTDASRPLAERGAGQAQKLVKQIAAWRPKKIVSSNAVRCRKTMEPLAKKLDLEVKATSKISQDAFHSGNDDVREVVGKIVRKRTSAVLCSHGPVIPEIVREIALATGTPTGKVPHSASLLDTASFAVFHLSSDRPSAGIIAIETYDTP